MEPCALKATLLYAYTIFILPRHTVIRVAKTYKLMYGSTKSADLEH